MKVISTVLKLIWSILKFILIPCVVVFCFIGFVVFVYFLISYCKGYRLKTGTHNSVHRDNFLRNFFINFPRRFVRDIFERDPSMFSHQGCVIFTGRQGYGKTIAMVEQCRLWQREYPLAKTLSNLCYTHENVKLKKWQQLIDYSNGIYGVIVMIDEMQNWFSSNQSKNFPPEMLQVITQNRKNRRVIMGTAQSFNRLSKPIREQATEVRKCFTIFGCVTFVHVVVPELDAEGNVEKWKHRRFYYFVHDQALRDSYDTYKVIESLRSSGFQDRVVFNFDSVNCPAHGVRDN